MAQLLDSQAVNAFLLVYAALFPIVNPLGSAPVFLSLTQRFSRKTRHSLAWRIALGGFLLLLGSLVMGSHVLEFFGVTLPVVRVGGGLVVTTMGWRLLNQGVVPGEHDPAERVDTAGGEPDAFYPLTMPLTVGPGSMSVAIALGSHRPQAIGHLAEFMQLAGGALAGLLAIAITVYVCYRFAENLERVLGTTGINVLVRLSAFILLCIGIEITWSGVAALLATVRP